MWNDDIMSSPDYGTWFLAAYEAKDGVWVCDVVCWESTLVNSSGMTIPATHWMPLPNLPSSPT